MTVATRCRTSHIAERSYWVIGNRGRASKYLAASQPTNQYCLIVSEELRLFGEYCQLIAEDHQLVTEELRLVAEQLRLIPKKIRVAADLWKVAVEDPQVIAEGL